MHKVYKIHDITIDYIIDYCMEEGEDAVAWLKEYSSRTAKYKVYPRVTDENGKSKVDKTQKPKMEARPISFFDIRNAFVEKYMPELKAKAKAKAPTMYDRIAALQVK